MLVKKIGSVVITLLLATPSGFAATISEETNTNIPILEEGYEAGCLGVQLKSGVSLTDADSAFSSISGFQRVVDMYPAWDGDSRTWVRVETTPGSEAQVMGQIQQKTSIVETVEPNYPVTAARTPNDPFYPATQPQTYFLPGADAAWDVTTGGPVITAILDTGIGLNDGSFWDGEPWNNPYEIPGNNFDDDSNGRIDDVYGVNFLSPPAVHAPPLDDNGHGTDMALILGAKSNNAAGFAGINWNARTMHLKVLDSAGNGSQQVVGSAIRYAVGMGANIINISLDGKHPWGTYVKQGFDIAEAAGVVVVQSAGNLAANEPPYDRGHPSVITVGAADGDQRASFSNRGSFVTVSAPGVNFALKGNRPSHPTFVSGTSYAAAVVSGLVGLMVSTENLTPAQVRSRLRTYARVPGGWDTAGMGAGIVNGANVGLYNQAPNVQVTGYQMPGTQVAALSGSVTDDARPANPGNVTVLWQRVSGPGSVQFDQPTSLATRATCSALGTHVFRMRAWDGARTTEKDVNVTLIAPPPTNQGPSVNAGADANVLLPNTLSLNGTSHDDGLPNPPAAMTYQWTMTSGPAAVTFVNPTALQTVATFTVPGTYRLRLSASDSVLSGGDEVSVTVAYPNAPPVVNAGADQTVFFPLQGTLAATATDDGQPTPPSAMTYQWSKVSGPDAVTFGSSASLQTSASFAALGIYTLRFSATDGTLTTTDDVVVTVSQPVNQAPVVSAGPDKTVILPDDLVISATDSDDGFPNPPARITVRGWHKLSAPANGNVVFVLPPPQGLSVTSYLPTTTARFSAPGEYVLRYTAFDGQLYSVDDMTVTVRQNYAPTTNAGPDRVITTGDFPATFNLSGHVEDDGLPVGANVTQRWTFVSGPVNPSMVNEYIPQTTASVYQAPYQPKPWGDYIFRLTSTDGTLSASDEVKITLRAPANSAPAVNAGPDQTITNSNQTNVSGSFTDDGLPLNASFSGLWSKLSGPGDVTFVNPPGFYHSPVIFSAAGAYVLRFAVTDGTLTGTDDVTINVFPGANQPPVADAGPDKTYVNSGVIAVYGGYSDDGLPIGGNKTYSWAMVSGPGDVTFLTPNALQSNIQVLKAGSYTMRLTVSDGASSDTDDVVLFYNPENSWPSVDVGADQQVTIPLMPGAPASVTLTGIASDDGLPNPPGALAYTWRNYYGPATGASVLSAPNALSTNVSFSDGGEYYFSLTADDGALSQNDTMKVIVNGGNRRPTIAALTDKTIYLNSGAPRTLVLAANIGDDGYPQPSQRTVAWSLISGPSEVTFTNSQTTYATHQETAQFSLPGVYVLRLTHSDGNLAAFRDITCTVINNIAPVVNAGEDQTVAMPGSIALSGSATDDNQPTPVSLRPFWTVKSAPVGGSVTFGNAQAFDTQATFSRSGTYVLELRVSDTQAAGTDEITVTPIVQNQAPIAGAGPDRSEQVGLMFWINGAGSDDGLPNPPGAITYQWSQVSGPTQVAPQNGSANSIAAMTINVAGVYVMRLTVSDSVLSGTDDVTLVINGPAGNVAPQVNAGADKALFAPEFASLTGEVTDDGLPSGQTTHTWSKQSGPGNVWFEDANALSTRAAFSEAGAYVLRLSASDGSLSGQDSLTVNVETTCEPGDKRFRVSAGGDKNAKRGETVTLDGSLTGGSGGGLKAASVLPTTGVKTLWTLVRGAGRAMIKNPEDLLARVTAQEAGEYVFRLTAEDLSTQTSSFDEMTLNVFLTDTPQGNTSPNVPGGNIAWDGNPIQIPATPGSNQVSVYNQAGDLMATLAVDETTGLATWDGQTRTGGLAADGVYMRKDSKGGVGKLLLRRE